MMSDISTRLENLSKTLGLNGKIAKSEMTAIGNELERLLSYFEETENGVFLLSKIHISETTRKN